MQHLQLFSGSVWLQQEAGRFRSHTEQRHCIMSLPGQLQFGVWRTRDLRELLEDEDKINHIVSCSEKFQRLQLAAEKMLVSNKQLAKASLSQKTKFRDEKLLLAMKYKELKRLRSIIQAKQEQLAEKYSLHYAEWCILKKINHAEEEFELLFQRFTEGKIALGDFLDLFLRSQKLLHIRLVLAKKLQEMITHEEKTDQSLSGSLPDAQYFSVDFAEQVHSVCSLTAAVVLPACCHPPFLLPITAHVHSAAHCLQLSTFGSDDDKSLHVGGRGLKWSARPVRLQPLKLQHRRHQQQ